MLQPVDVALLQAPRSYPSISLFLNRSDPAADRIRLRGLVDTTQARLARETRPEAIDLIAQLQRLVGGVDLDQEWPAVALFVNQDVAHAVELPHEVVERVVIDETFATRDLVHGLQRRGPSWAVVLDERVTRLYQGLGNTFAIVRGGGFPLVRDPGRDAGRRGGREHGRREAELRRFLVEVDEAIGPHLAVDQAPLFVLGSARRVAAFTDRSRHRSAVEATITVFPTDARGSTVARLLEPAVAERRRFEQDRALAELEAFGGGASCASGLQDVWRLAGEGRGELLVVEEGFAEAALVDESGVVRPAPDPEHPEAVDDLVDEVVEVVLAHRGRAVFVPDGSLADRGRAALRLRY